MKTGRPRKLGIWTAKLIRLYRYLGYDMQTLTERFGVSERTIYRYTTKGGYNVNDKKRLRKNSQDS
jgi:transposase